MDETISDLIHKSASENEITEYAYSNNKKLFENGLLALKDGKTSLSELLKNHRGLMATFKYSAFNHQEKKISGYINAADQVEAMSLLQNKGLNPLSITESEQKKSNIKVSTKDLSIFTKQMAALLSAGTPLEKSLELLASKQLIQNSPKSFWSSWKTLQKAIV